MCQKKIAFRLLTFLLSNGGSVDATVESEKFRQSPITKGGIEITLKATFRIEESKRLILRTKGLIQKSYKLDLPMLS